MHILKSPFLFCSLVPNADILFLFCVGIFPKNLSTFPFESNGSLTISVSLSTNFVKSESSGSFLWFCIVASNFLNYLTLALPTILITAYT